MYLYSYTQWKWTKHSGFRWVWVEQIEMKLHWIEFQCLVVFVCFCKKIYLPATKLKRLVQCAEICSNKWNSVSRRCNKFGWQPFLSNSRETFQSKVQNLFLLHLWMLFLSFFYIGINEKWWQIGFFFFKRPMLLISLHQMVIKANDNGDYFPLYGACLGFQLLTVIVSQVLLS